MSTLESPDPRIPPPFVTSGERAMLNTWLEFHRATLIWKCTGLTDEQLRLRSVPPSSLSLLGLVRHMTEVERAWFQRVFLGTDSPHIYSAEPGQDGDFDDVDTADVASDLARFAEECQNARIAEASAESLDVTGVNRRDGELVSLRWILVHMIEEYARHNGHADLIRECIDGATGD